MRTARTAMFPGGERAQVALLLALLAICGAATPGCRPRAQVSPRAYSVRIEPLLPLHPAWQQVLLLQRGAGQFAAAQPRPDGIVLAMPGLPSNFQPPQKVPPSLVAERRRRLQEEAARYVDNYAEQVAARNRAIYDQEARVARADAAAAYQRELAARRKTLQDEADARAQVLMAERERLAYRLVALRSQIAVYTAQAQADAIAQRDKLRADVAAIDRERLATLAAVELKAIEAAAPARARLDAELAQHLAQRQKELDQEAKSLTDRERERLSAQPDPIPPLGTTPPPARYLHETALPLPTPQQTQQAILAAQSRVAARVAAKRTEWQSQQARLVELIRADTRRSVEQIAAERGWRLVPEGTRGAVDATQMAAAAIRAQWRVP